MPKRDKDKLSVEGVQADPLALVNANDEQLREFFGEIKVGNKRLDEKQVTNVVTFAQRYRRVYEAALAEPYDFDLENEAVENLVVMWFRQSPKYQPWPTLVRRGSEVLHVKRNATVTEAETFEVWNAVRVNELAGDEWTVSVWEWLWELLEEGDPRETFLMCAHCGEIQERGRVDQKYCDNTCRQAAHRARQRIK